jgi:hypothetical protein
MPPFQRTLAALLTALSLAAPAAAEVADSSAHGFTIRLSFSLKAAPEDAYRKLVRNIGEWWDSAHTFSGDARNLSIEERPMGCFCEKLPNQGGVRHMQVALLAPGKSLVLSGGLGPLLMEGATGAMRIQFAPAEGGTKLEVTYAVGGYTAKGMNTWSAPVDAVLTQQFTRFRNYVDRGEANPKPAP